MRASAPACCGTTTRWGSSRRPDARWVGIGSIRQTTSGASSTWKLEEADPNVAGALRWALRRSNDEALDVLGPALDSPEALTRHRAVTAIAELETENATTLLITALTHTDPAVREYAALTLGARGNARAIPERGGARGTMVRHDTMRA